MTETPSGQNRDRPLPHLLRPAEPPAPQPEPSAAQSLSVGCVASWASTRAAGRRTTPARPRLVLAQAPAVPGQPRPSAWWPRAAEKVLGHGICQASRWGASEPPTEKQANPRLLRF